MTATEVQNDKLIWDLREAAAYLAGRRDDKPTDAAYYQDLVIAVTYAADMLTEVFNDSE